MGYGPGARKFFLFFVMKFLRSVHDGMDKYKIGFGVLKIFIALVRSLWLLRIFFLEQSYSILRLSGHHTSLLPTDLRKIVFKVCKNQTHAVKKKIKGCGSLKSPVIYFLVSQSWMRPDPLKLPLPLHRDQLRYSQHPLPLHRMEAAIPVWSCLLALCQY